jgi:hypothetical protein
MWRTVTSAPRAMSAATTGVISPCIAAQKIAVVPL